MLLPSVSDVAASRDMISTFGGYNHGDVVPSGQFTDMQNMTSSSYPILSPRGERGKGSAVAKPNGILSKGCLYWVDGVNFYGNDGEGGATVLRGAVTDSPKMFASMGAYVLIWPDRKYYDIHTKLFGDLEKTWTAASDTTVTYTLTKWDPSTKASSGYTETITVSAAAPTSPTDAMLWLDTSGTTHVLKQYAASSKSWTAVATTYVKIAAEGVGVGFSRGDGVKIAGSTNSYFNNTFVVYDVGEDYIVVIGIIDQSITQTGGLTVSRSVPDMDFITECNNRLWGCSSANHEVYACKLGDPFNWNCYENISTDSYAATIGSDGDFTGAVTHLGYVLFFKEDCVHKIYGSRPANFQLTSTILHGVEKGSEKSLAIMNGTLFYKAGNGIMTYDGGLPTDISAAFGNVSYSDAVAGACGNKYYVSMKDGSGNWHLFVYDAARGMWHREDNTHALEFAALDNNLYFIDAADNTLRTVSGSGEGSVDWYAQTGDIGDDSPDRKYISKLQIKLSMETGSEMTVQLQYDSDGQWETVSQLTSKTKNTFSLPVIPRRCDHFSLKLSGKGPCKIFSITKMLEDGSEL